MKKIVSFFLLFALFFTLFGCDSAKTKKSDSRKANKTDYVDTTFRLETDEESNDETVTDEAFTDEATEYSGYPIEWVSDVSLYDIRHIKRDSILNVQSEMFITKSGDLYLFSTDKLYSDNQVCKKVETDIKFECFYSYTNDRDISYLVSEDGTVYGYNEENGELFKPEHPDDFELELRELYPDLNTVCEGGYQSRHHIYYMDGNNLHKCTYVFVYEPEYGWAFEGDTIIDTLPEGEIFISMDGRAIKSDKAYYEIGTVNSEEVDKYEDVEPIEGLVELTKLTEQYDNIYYFNGTFLVYKDDGENLYNCTYTQLK